MGSLIKDLVGGTTRCPRTWLGARREPGGRVRRPELGPTAEFTATPTPIPFVLPQALRNAPRRLTHVACCGQGGQLELGGKEVLVDFFNLGRVALYAQSLDGKSAWMYNDETQGWDALDDSYLRELTKGIRIARKQGAPDLFSLPIPAAEAAQ